MNTRSYAERYTVMRAAYADPPYLGQARRHYQCAEIDYPALIRLLHTEYDAWALSCSSTSLRMILPQCRPDTRVAAWVKPFAFFHSGTHAKPPYAWEPVLFWTDRRTDHRPHGVRDWLLRNAWGVTKAERNDPLNVKGMKPPEFSVWVFYLLGLRHEDEFIDLFPGSGAVTRAWEQWKTMARST